jgi:hypothetical protein
MKATLALLSLLDSCALSTSCGRNNAGASGLSYKVDTVTFVAAAPIPPAAGPQPNVHIDANMKMSGMLGRTITRDKSTRPWGEVMLGC